MQSTSSSADSRPTLRSPTEELAARYRHLFVLPRTTFLVLSAVVVSVMFSLAALNGAWADASIASSLVVLASSFIVDSVLKLKERNTIASFRRVVAVVLASQTIWLILLVIADAYSFLTGTTQHSTNAIFFGAFVCTGFEFIVIRGAFSRNLALSIMLAAVHPLGTLLVVGRPPGTVPITAVAMVGGLVSFIIMAAFPLMLARTKTSEGYDAIELFQAFMKTWTTKNSADLESIIQAHAEPAVVTTKVMKFQREDEPIFIFLPGVHPGPFFPVGSYNMPGLISNEMRGLGPVMVLHRPGGHERNLASNEQARLYASKLREFALTVEAVETGTVRGPIQARIGKAIVNSMGFSRDLLLTISFAPFGSDDLDTDVEERIARLASTCGFSSTVVDAHNSISQKLERPDIQDGGWLSLIESTWTTTPKTFRIAFAHSSEVDFSRGQDITENGVGLLMLETEGAKSVMVLADANNAVPELREKAARALELEGYTLIEFCTSDSHDMAAKGLTVTRGYKALGEDTPLNSIDALVVALARIADSRLLACRYGSGEFTQSMKLFGSDALEEFALMTRTSSRLALRYSKFAILTISALFALSITL